MFRSEDWDLVYQTLSANINSLVSLRDRTAKRLKAANVTGLLLACFVGNSLNIIFFCSSTKRSVLEMWSLAKGFFKKNYCHACHTRFAVVFPLPSCCVSSLLSEYWDKGLKVTRFVVSEDLGFASCSTHDISLICTYYADKRFMVNLHVGQ